MNNPQLAVEIQSDTLRLCCVPELGGTVTDFSLRASPVVAGADEWLPIMRRHEGPLSRSSHGANFPLAPYSNRLKDGRFTFEGVTHQLGFPEKHAIHGDVRDRPWNVTEQSATGVTMAFDSRRVEAFNFPFPMAATLAYRLDGTTLHTSLSLTNVGATPMPVGGGFHPYFNRSLTAGEDVSVGFCATGLYEAGEPPIPESAPVSIPASLSFVEPRALDQPLDHCFSGWDGVAALHWPKSGVTAQMRANRDLSHIIVYAPPGESFFAIEPVANANNGFNLASAGVPNTGVTTLAPGASRTLAFALAISGH